MVSNAALRSVIIVLGFVGFALSLYLLREHYTTVPGTFCNINETFNCTTVNQSGYAELFGVPVALLGALFYLAVLAFGMPASLRRFLRVDEQLVALGFLGWTVFGIIFSAYLTAVEAFLLHVFCPLCLASAFLVLLLFGIALLLYRRTTAVGTKG